MSKNGIEIDGVNYEKINRQQAKQLWERGVEIYIAALWENIKEPVFDCVEKIHQTGSFLDFDKMVKEHEENSDFCFPDIGEFVKFYADEKDIKELKSDMKVGDYRDVESARREGKQKAAEVDFIILGKQIGENEYEAKLYKGKEEVHLWATEEEQKKLDADFEKKRREAMRTRSRVRPKAVKLTEHVKLVDDKILLGYAYQKWEARDMGYLDVTNSAKVDMVRGNPGTMLYLTPEAEKKYNMYRVEVVDYFDGLIRNAWDKNAQVYRIPDLENCVQGVAGKRDCVIKNNMIYREIQGNENGRVREVFNKDEVKKILSTASFLIDKELNSHFDSMEKEFKEYGLDSAKHMLNSIIKNTTNSQIKKLLQDNKFMYQEQFMENKIEAENKNKKVRGKKTNKSR